MTRKVQMILKVWEVEESGKEGGTAYSLGVRRSECEAGMWFVLSHLCVCTCVYLYECVFIGGVELFSCPVTFVCKWICIQNSLLVKKQHSASLQNRFCAPALQFWIREGRKERPSSCFLALRAAGGSQQCLKEKVNLLVNKWLPHCGGVQIIRGMFG